MYTEEFIPPNYVFKEYVSKKENNTTDLNRLRFSSPEVAERYLRKFSAFERVLANCLLHPKTREFNAAQSVRMMSQQELNRMRNIYFYGCIFLNSSNPLAPRLVLEKDDKLYVESSRLLFSIN